MDNVHVNMLGRIALEDQPLEIVERKGLGHPDTICDAVMNQISVDLSKEYLNKFGVVLHHNVDKSLLAAGIATPAFKGGKILEPMRFVFGDRATFKVGDEEIPVDEIAAKSASNWLKENLRFVDPAEHVVFQSQIKPGSMALADIFDRKGKFLGSNDTSAAVGYAPYTKTETVILDLERHLNSKSFKDSFPESGEDIKLMGLRKGGNLDITVAMAMVDRYIDSEDDYFKKQGEIKDAIHGFVDDKFGFDKIHIDLNALDVKGRGIDGLYLTINGTSAEAGDSGQVGRGNNVAGVIPLNRPMSAEAAAGKNPVSHVGKIYNALSYRISNRIVEDVSGVREVYVWILSQIGKPINEPSVVSAQIVPAEGVELESVNKQIDEVIAKEFDHLAEFCDDLAQGKIALC
ncbi:methionine adenosyltransferase [Candidatus Bathyarchaeota archaeon]|jgi:S-adenosylmethionine synthetase|nr:methionine adenosyltransferase [Candidatus Bathyarchaeota archaeon]MBT4319342.1 methionine adenosyltransferase [Candidatus Bathyarchaeota archaeon]MBT4424879.1 methionine adenosyltransferase [Candidatus Bathyarchaeota archaeon]MBT7186601.1 methionine adenosyltransferase [Candidatus Bathyarchaeota archaeon]MBT7347055.1 methionine adenosyltransferase [Candidatus Bathyarchaeota archaeon]